MGMFFSSLYVHVPLCIKKCKYCSFYSLSYDEDIERLYIKALLKEIEIAKEIPHIVKTIYIGGGTPSCLSIQGLERILLSLRKNFKTAYDLEFSIEINPKTINMQRLCLMKDFGVNRLSIGVQSFNDKELLFLGRIHNSKDAIKTVELALNQGFRNISIDLIYGIPIQTLKSWQETLNKAVNINVVHISLYELSVEHNTQLENELKLKRFSLPSEDEVIAMYDFATDFLESRGYNKYEISNFAKDGFQCRHNISYWLRMPYLGLGPSAHSFIDNKRFHNPSDLIFYAKTLLNGKFGWIYDYSVDKVEELKEKIFLGLRMKNGITLEKKCLLDFFKIFEQEQLLILSGNTVRLTNKGMTVSNEIFAQVLLHIENCPVCKQE
ncbi:MAG: radical SAM family heme chaperone HemW [Thermodesulfovibrio sp.]|nr:radical SAM family heme chaperone HemW [Thermodesulfovibrio sp.]MCX7723713.1 radical SAM family heme chaperone HemW [Thermodesulfovibrio sp.]